MSRFWSLSQHSLLGVTLPLGTVNTAKRTASCACITRKRIAAAERKNIFVRQREIHTSLPRQQSVEKNRAQEEDYSKDAFLPTPKLNPTHGIKVAELRFESFYNDRNDLNFHVDFVRRVAAAFGIPCSLPDNVTRNTELITVPAAPFVHKRSQENYWKRTIAIPLVLYDANQTVVNKFIDYLDANPPIDIRVQITRYSYETPGWGQKLAESIAPVLLESNANGDSSFDFSLDDPDVRDKVNYIRKQYKMDMAISAEDGVDLDKYPSEEKEAKEIEKETETR